MNEKSSDLYVSLFNKTMALLGTLSDDGLDDCDLRRLNVMSRVLSRIRKSHNALTRHDLYLELAPQHGCQYTIFGATHELPNRAGTFVKVRTHDRFEIPFGINTYYKRIESSAWFSSDSCKRGATIEHHWYYGNGDKYEGCNECFMDCEQMSPIFMK